jgi:hypothetical protein
MSKARSEKSKGKRPSSGTKKGKPSDPKGPSITISDEEIVDLFSKKTSPSKARKLRRLKSKERKLQKGFV